MDPSVPLRKTWFPYIKLSIFFVVFVTTMYFTLELFNPHLDVDPSQWQGDKSPKIKKIEWMFKLLQPKQKK